MKPLNQNRMKTAVEWLVEKIKSNRKKHFGYKNFGIDFKEVIQQAIEMEKEQMELIYYGHNQYNDEHLDFEQYYNETFKQQ